MKKTIAILLVAVLAAGSVFAGFSGSASVKAGYDLQNKEYGFFENGTNVKLNLELGTQVAEEAGEGDVYASIKATLEARVMNDPYRGDGNVVPYDKNAYVNGYFPVSVIAKVTEAKVNGSNWYVSILGVPSVPDFAKSAIDTYKDKKADVDFDEWGFKYKDDVKKPDTYKVDYDKAPGVEVGYADYVVGVGFKSDASGKAFTAYAKTPEYTFDAVKAQFAAVASKKAGTGIKNVGASAKASYATDVLSVSLATDLGAAIANETKFNADVAANFKYDFVTVDAYFATKAKSITDKNLLSVKAVTDLNSFEVPVKLSLTGKDLINKQNLKAEVEFVAVEGLTVKANAGYVIADKKVSVGGGVEYKADAYKATANAGFETKVGTENSNVLTFDAAVESDVIIPGATLKLAYGKTADDQNLLSGQTLAQDLGKVEASCTIKF